MEFKRISPSFIKTNNAVDGDFLVFNAANNSVEFIPGSNTWTNANDYATYTTLVGFINTVQDNVSAGGGGDASNAWVNANDYTTYTALQGEFAANDYSTLLAAQSNDYSTYTALQGEFAANDYSTLLAAKSNDY